MDAEKLKAWHETNEGLLVFAIVELALMYAIGSRAIDTGSTWQYLLTIIFLIGGIKNLSKFVRNLIRGKRKSKEAR